MFRRTSECIVLTSCLATILSGCTTLSVPLAENSELFRQESSLAVASTAEHNNDPTVPKGKLALARLTERQGNKTQAKRIYEACIQEGCDSTLPHHRLGVLAAKDGKFQEAMEHFNVAASIGAPTAQLLSDIGYVHYLQHRLDDAQRILTQAIEQEPQHKAACINLGLVFGAKRQFRDSFEMFKRAGSEAEAYNNLAYVYSQLGDLEQATGAYSKALSMDDRLDTAAKALVQISRYREPAPKASRPGPTEPGSQSLGDARTDPVRNNNSTPDVDLVASIQDNMNLNLQSAVIGSGVRLTKTDNSREPTTTKSETKQPRISVAQQTSEMTTSDVNSITTAPLPKGQFRRLTDTETQRATRGADGQRTATQLAADNRGQKVVATSPQTKPLDAHAPAKPETLGKSNPGAAPAATQDAFGSAAVWDSRLVGYSPTATNQPGDGFAQPSFMNFPFDQIEPMPWTVSSMVDSSGSRAFVK